MICDVQIIHFISTHSNLTGHLLCRNIPFCFMIFSFFSCFSFANLRIRKMSLKQKTNQAETKEVQFTLLSDGKTKLTQFCGDWRTLINAAKTKAKTNTDERTKTNTKDKIEVECTHVGRKNQTGSIPFKTLTGAACLH